MRPNLTRTASPIHYYADNKRIDGPPPGVTGSLAGVSGNLTGVGGDLSGVRGELSGITGTASGITGDLTGITGNFDDCNITDADRKRGVHIDVLVK